MKRSTLPRAGFSLIEVLVAITIFVVIVGIVLVFLGTAHRNLETESGGLETQQGARVAMDELSRNIQMAGYGILRTDPGNPGSWQRDVIYAGPYALFFNAEIDATIGGLSPSNTLALPDGTTYKGQGPAAYTTGAETYVYTIDANGDGSFTSADHTATPSGSSNPAAETQNPLDYALFRRVYGYNGSDYGGTVVPITGGLFTNATTTDLYGDGTSPNPLFSYWLTEDLNRDNVLANSECVVLPCPPSSTRVPQLYLWGDTDFDGKLSESEKTALRTLPVGSASWSKNRLASAGDYYFTTLSTAYDPSGDGVILQVASAASFGVGEHVQIGADATAETFLVASTVTTSTPQQILLAASPRNAHGAGDKVTILPQTLLRAIRTVQVNFDAITPKKDYDNATASAAVGRAGHAGTKGLEYRVRPFERKLELINLQTSAVVQPSTVPTCPTTFTASCSGGAITTIDIIAPRSGTIPVTFLLADAEGTPMMNKTVDFANSDTSIGTLSATSATSNSSGIATVQYTPTGTNGVDTITGSNSCLDNTLTQTTMTATLTHNVYKLETTLTGNDCLQTFRSGYAAPSSAFTVKVKNPAGSVVSKALVTLGLAFDPAFLPGTPDYTKVEGQLSTGGSPVGVTDSAAGSFSLKTDTTAGGILGGSFELTKDTDGYGTRLLMTTTVDDVACSKYGVTLPLAARFYKLAIGSVLPTTYCTESAPCNIAAGASPLPRVNANLSLNQVVSAGVPITLTRSDYVKPSLSASSILSPSSGWTSDVNGDASANVYNNNDPAIGIASPLRTRIDASSLGDAGVCTNGNIGSTTLRPEFWFQGPTAVGCDVDLQQAWIKKFGSNDKVCIDVQNKGPIGGCDVSLVGMKFGVWKADGSGIDTTKFKLQKLSGGDNVATTGTCSVANLKQLFIKDCNRFCAAGVNVGLVCTSNADCPSSTCPGAQDLINDTRFDFLNYTTKCFLPLSPPNPIGPQEYFEFTSADFSDNLVTANRRFVVTVYFQCAGICSGATQAKTFDLMSP